LFASNTPEDNVTLRYIQQMPMAQRRHAVFILLGNSFNTLNTLQAFQQSVHAVVNRDEMELLGPSILAPIIQRVTPTTICSSTSIATPSSKSSRASAEPA
jgi:hypothetical protein